MLLEKEVQLNLADYPPSLNDQMRGLEKKIKEIMSVYLTLCIEHLKYIQYYVNVQTYFLTGLLLNMMIVLLYNEDLILSTTYFWLLLTVSYSLICNKDAGCSISIWTSWVKYCWNVTVPGHYFADGLFKPRKVSWCVMDVSFLIIWKRRTLDSLKYTWNTSQDWWLLA